jgi:hypothetical protein
MIFDPDPFNPPWLIIAAPFVFAGLSGLVFRKHWALWYSLVLWIVCLLLIFYAYFSDVRKEETFFPRYFWLYEHTFYFFSGCILSCWFGIWLCNRRKRQEHNIEENFPISENNQRKEL